MTRENRDNPEPKDCPECGAELATETHTYDDIPVAITICTNFPDCSYFYWSVPGNSSNPHRSLLSGELGRWAVKKSLSVLHDALSPKEWNEALASISNPLDGGGEGE